MALHTQKRSADELIKKRRPNEPEDVHKYRKDNFEHITNQAIIRAINNLQRFFSQTKATVRTDQDTKDYLHGANFQGVDFDTYLNQRVINRMIDDPNGLLVWWPERVGDQTKRVEPKPLLVLSEHVQHWKKGEYISWLSDEKSPLKTNKGEVAMEGKVYYVIDTDGFWKYTQIGGQGKEDYELDKWYDQKYENGLPVILLGGEVTSVRLADKEVHYLASYFSGFVPFANEALRQFSDHQAIMVTAGHPIREMEGADCSTCSGKGKIKSKDPDSASGYTYRSCKDCNGLGMRIPVSPYGVLFKRASKGGVLEGKADVSEALRYISPDVDIIKYSGEHWQELLLLAEKSLNLNYIDEAQSGVAKEIDRENLQAMLDRIGTNIYLNIYRNSIRNIQTLRTRGKKEEVEIIMPNSFKIRSETDLVNELNTLVEKDAPMYLVVNVAKELTKKRYAGDEDIVKGVDVLAEYDPYFALPLEKRSEMLAIGAMLRSEFRKSLHSFNALLSVIREAEDFSEMEYTAIAAKLDDKLAPYLQDNGGTEPQP